MKNFLPRLANLRAPLLFALVVISLPQPARSGVVAASNQRREHLTEQEVEMVRDTQELDRRIALFIKFVERRMPAVANSAAAQAPPDKDIEKWGELPKGSRSARLYDIARILDEAINNIDDVAARTPGSSLLPKAVKKLSEASARFLPQLAPLRESAIGEGEREALEQVIDSLEEIVDAAKKLPAEEATPAEKKDEKKGEKKKN
ncbi:MAG TPA: hypothetical protein VJ842_20455 [Pyrinomonadaceae bacterium]|nr:hypothetical protein [Pyrinomonadaceae bacterium]